MHPVEKTIQYQASNTYSTLNTLTEHTKNIWVVFHGIGFLSRYFVKYFDVLPSRENYIIAPQAPSKYYLNNQYKHVGASWLTKEMTRAEIDNNLRYIEQVFQAEKVLPHHKLIVFGFSQGVSMAARWVAKGRIPCRKLIFYAGGIPNELQATDFDHLKADTEVLAIIGDKDEYLTPERLVLERKKMETLFSEKAQEINFDGGHELKSEIINQLT